jgi:K+ transporter
MNLFSLSNLYFLFELFTLMLCIIYVRKIQGSVIRYLPLYMLVIVLFDVIAFYRRSSGLPNTWINDVVIPFEFCCLMLLCRCFFAKKNFRRFTFVLVFLYLFFFVIDELFYRETYSRLYLRSYLAGVLGLLIIIVLYIYELLNSDRLFKFYRQPEFWISAGVLLFYLGTLPFHLAWNVASVKFIKAYATTKGIFYFLICTMYVFFSISILCLKPKMK